MYNITNSVSLTGHLGKDVEINTLENGSVVANVSIATNQFYTNSKGQKVQDVTWHNVEAWNKTAELMGQLLKKGSLVQVQGMLKNNTYKSKEGSVRNYTKIRVSNFKALTKNEEALPF
ncbi:single-stranded DNA-binding protein [Portibacter marinus]|uniref:single-stranded DNA-binding protein n=1 Tax=Portibacter marinus TaxID=2898660 RepID=UPI001F28F5DB|nr:single-stranded DNA-binding protein [Portibacter marinus]